MIDGISAMDTGNNGLMGGLNLPIDQVAEVKVITSGYNAEYGRSIGLQVSAVTKSGTNRFHGSFYDYERHSDWNSNSWANQQNGIAKAVNDQRDWGYSIGGPVGKPGGNNKLFFFYTSEYRPRTTGNNVDATSGSRPRSSAAAISPQTVDQNGSLVQPDLRSEQRRGPAEDVVRRRRSRRPASPMAACWAGFRSTSVRPGHRAAESVSAAELPAADVPELDAERRATTISISTPVTNTLTFAPTYRVDYQLSSNCAHQRQVERPDRARRAEHRQHSRASTTRSRSSRCRSTPRAPSTTR